MIYIVEVRSSNSLAYVITRATPKILCHEQEINYHILLPYHFGPLVNQRLNAIMLT